MKLAPEHVAALIAHAQRDAPNECCGLVIEEDGEAVEVRPMENTQASAMRFEMDGLAVMRVFDEVEDTPRTVTAMYHSHPRSEPYPSATDINIAKLWPGLEWIIVGLRPQPHVRRYLIDGGVVTELP